jgi:hypothetical protein
VAGPGVWICNECIALCSEIMIEELGAGWERVESSPKEIAVIDRAPASDQDTEGIAESAIELCPLDLVETTDSLATKNGLRHGEHVVAQDDARLGQAMLVSDLDLGADASDRSGDRRTRDRSEHFYRGVLGKHADRPAPRGWHRPVVAADQSLALWLIAFSIAAIVAAAAWVAAGRNASATPLQQRLWRSRWIIVAIVLIVGFLLASSLGYTA